MGTKYRIKKGSGCKMCKPHKGGWCDKHKPKHRAIMVAMDKEIEDGEDTKG